MRLIIDTILLTHFFRICLLMQMSCDLNKPSRQLFFGLFCTMNRCSLFASEEEKGLSRKKVELFQFLLLNWTSLYGSFI